MPDGTFWTLTDNGFGAKANSSDAALVLRSHQNTRLGHRQGRCGRQPVPLPTPTEAPFADRASEGADKRYLNGGDFDIGVDPTVAAASGSAMNSGPSDQRCDEPDGKLTDCHRHSQWPAGTSPDNTLISLRTVPPKKCGLQPQAVPWI